jgi:hypothetical protein
MWRYELLRLAKAFFAALIATMHGQKLSLVRGGPYQKLTLPHASFRGHPNLSGDLTFPSPELSPLARDAAQARVTRFALFLPT